MAQQTDKFTFVHDVLANYLSSSDFICVGLSCGSLAFSLCIYITENIKKDNQCGSSFLCFISCWDVKSLQKILVSWRLLSHCWLPGEPSFYEIFKVMVKMFDTVIGLQNP